MATTKIGTKKRIRIYTYEIARDGTSTATDPTLLTIWIDLPVGVTITSAWPTDGVITKIATGDFEYLYTTTESGKHEVRCAATGAIVVAEQTTFVVAASNVTV